MIMTQIGISSEIARSKLRFHRNPNLGFLIKFLIVKSFHIQNWAKLLIIKQSIDSLINN